jgi:hypothetical protein
MVRPLEVPVPPIIPQASLGEEDGRQLELMEISEPGEQMGYLDLSSRPLLALDKVSYTHASGPPHVTLTPLFWNPRSPLEYPESTVPFSLKTQHPIRATKAEPGGLPASG